MADNSRKVWAVAMFCLWHAVEVEQTISAAPSRLTALVRA